MNAYHEMVNRVLAVKQAELEMGLVKSREQKPFIEQVSRVLDKTSWDYVAVMDKDFNVCFTLERGVVDFKNQYQAVRQALAERFEVAFGVAEECPVLDVNCRRSGYGCRVVFGETP